MRLAIIEALAAWGLPAWLAPGYYTMVMVAALLALPWMLRWTRRDGVDTEVEARALAAGYVAAMLGGYLIESVRALPRAIEHGHVGPLLTAGKAAYGGLIFGLLAAAVVVRWQRRSLAAFFDRLSILLGVTFACVRCGCFLAGCDYGQATASVLGVRFPAGSPAAVAHAHRGWVPDGSASLPVHPTQLYEAALGLVALLAALYWLRRGHRDGRAFASWLAVYAVGRFTIELWRGDLGRGLYGGISSAQLISIALVLGLAAWLGARRSRLVPALLGLALFIAPASADAQVAAPAPRPKNIPEGYEQQPDGSWVFTGKSTPAADDGGDPDGSDADDADGGSDQQRFNQHRHVSLRFGTGFYTPFIAHVNTQALIDGTLAYRVPITEHHRLELGVLGAITFGAEANHPRVGGDLRLVFGVADNVELFVGATPSYAVVDFDSDFFASQEAFMMGMDLGLAFPIGEYVALGVAPLSTSFMRFLSDVDPIDGSRMPTIFAYNPTLFVSGAL